jgi:hypothetical protein
MININLTGASPNNREISQSLGGCISSYPFQNGDLFSDISKYDFQIGKREIVVLALTNNTGADISDLMLYTEIEDPTSMITVEVGAEYFVNDKVELLQNSADLPFYVDFVDANGIANQVNVGALDAGESISIWFKREVPKVEPDCEASQVEGKNKVSIFFDY